MPSDNGSKIPDFLLSWIATASSLNIWNDVVLAVVLSLAIVFIKDFIYYILDAVIKKLKGRR